MKIKSAILFLSVFFLYLPLAGAPQISTERINFQHRAIGKAAWEQIYVVSLIYPHVPHTVQSGEILTRMQQKYRKNQVNIIVLMPSTNDNISKFASDYPEFDFTVVPDPEFKYLSRLYKRQKTFPQTGIFNNAGKLLWSGDPLDLPMMLKIIIDKKYSEREEIRISALNSGLQAALRTGNPDLIGKAADQILALRPEQLSAVNAKAYSLEIARDSEGLKKFFQDRIKRYPKAPENYFMLLEASLRIAELANTAPQTARSFIQAFPADVESINAVAWSLLNRAPFDAQAFAVVRDCCNILQKSPEKATGKILMTQALFAYRCCKLPEARQLAKQAAAKAVNAQEKLFIKNFSEYLNMIER